MADLFDTCVVPLREQIECAERELKLRRHVYPRRITAGHMTQQLADRETARMEAILESLKDLAVKEERR